VVIKRLPLLGLVAGFQAPPCLQGRWPIVIWRLSACRVGGLGYKRLPACRVGGLLLSLCSVMVWSPHALYVLKVLKHLPLFGLVAGFQAPPCVQGRWPTIIWRLSACRVGGLGYKRLPACRVGGLIFCVQLCFGCRMLCSFD